MHAPFPRPRLQMDHKAGVWLYTLILVSLCVFPWTSSGLEHFWDVLTLLEVPVLLDKSPIYLLKFVAIGSALVSLYSLAFKNTPHRIANVLVFLSLFLLIFWNPLRLLFEPDKPPGWLSISIEQSIDLHGTGAWLAFLAAIPAIFLPASNSSTAQAGFVADVRDWLDQELGLPRLSTSQRVINAALCGGIFFAYWLFIRSRDIVPSYQNLSLWGYPFSALVLLLFWQANSRNTKASTQISETGQALLPPTWTRTTVFFKWTLVVSAFSTCAAGHANAFQRLDPANYWPLGGSWSMVLWTLLLYLPLLLMLTSWWIRIAAAPIGPKTQRVVIGMGIVSLAYLFWSMPNQLFGINLYTKVSSFYPEPSLGIDWSIALYPSTIATLLVVFACSRTLDKIPWTAIGFLVIVMNLVYLLLPTADAAFRRGVVIDTCIAFGGFWWIQNHSQNDEAAV